MKETVSTETVQPSTRSTAVDQISSPRISFSADFLDDCNNFISITPTQHKPPQSPLRNAAGDNQFEFLSSGGEPKSGHARMLTADELFFEGKLLPFWQMQQSERLNKISLKSKEEGDELEDETAGTPTTAAAMNWFVDDDPSPRPPKCTVLWKELLRLKKQRPVSSLSPSSSSSSTSSSSSSLGDVATKEEGKGGGSKKGSQQVKRAKKGLERTRSSSIRIRPMINVPICSQMKSSSHHHHALPPFFPLKKGRVLER
ncbi:hypothetical protein LINGRAHAP2_LOCUS6554 [Linum grandiflorum]